MLTRLVALAAIAALLSGCVEGNFTNSEGGQSAAGAGHLAYNGSAAGKHQSVHDCPDGDGTVRFSANLGMGRVSVRVMDPAGNPKYGSVANGSGQTFDSQQVSGAPGRWLLTAERTASNEYGTATWSGQYDLSLAC